MPLPVTPSYERALRDLRKLSPDTAALAERIALDLQPQVSTTKLEVQLLGHLQAVAQQQASSVTRLASWLNAVARNKELTFKQATDFVNEAATLGGPSSVVLE